MKEFKGTKGEWYYDEISKGIKNDKVKGLLATAWSVYNSEETEIRLDNESWLDMRRRTDIVRKQKKLEREANAKLIAAAPDMLEMLQILTDVYSAENIEKAKELLTKILE